MPSPLDWIKYYLLGQAPEPTGPELPASVSAPEQGDEWRWNSLPPVNLSSDPTTEFMQRLYPTFEQGQGLDAALEGLSQSIPPTSAPQDVAKLGTKGASIVAHNAPDVSPFLTALIGSIFKSKGNGYLVRDGHVFDLAEASILDDSVRRGAEVPVSSANFVQDQLSKLISRYPNLGILVQEPYDAKTLTHDILNKSSSVVDDPFVAREIQQELRNGTFAKPGAGGYFTPKALPLREGPVDASWGLDPMNPEAIFDKANPNISVPLIATRADNNLTTLIHEILHGRDYSTLRKLGQNFRGKEDSYPASYLRALGLDANDWFGKVTGLPNENPLMDLRSRVMKLGNGPRLDPNTEQYLRYAHTAPEEFLPTLVGETFFSKTPKTIENFADLSPFLQRIIEARYGPTDIPTQPLRR